MTKNCEERCKKKNDRFNVVAQQGNVFDRHIQPPMNELPDRLDIVGEVERPILEVRPAGIGRPGAEEEEQARERANDYLARLNRLPLSRAHLKIRMCLAPSKRLGPGDLHHAERAAIPQEEPT